VAGTLNTTPWPYYNRVQLYVIASYPMDPVVTLGDIRDIMRLMQQSPGLAARLHCKSGLRAWSRPSGCFWIWNCPPLSLAEILAALGRAVFRERRNCEGVRASERPSERDGQTVTMSRPRSAQTPFWFV
jgi:hypothetical protein